MDATSRIEQQLELALQSSASPDCPPTLAQALRYSVFPGGARIRPRLCLAVSWACGDDDPEASAAAGAAIEMLHCASLVHDDLPCFDDADVRRGKPSVHRAFGEPLAVLAGDALIVLAFETMALQCHAHPHRLGTLVSILGKATGAAGGIAAGQAWESERSIDLEQYHRAKTGVLFAAATMAGAASAGALAEPWRDLGELIGEAYQVADDIRDVACAASLIGKPVGQDALLARPSAAREMGLKGAVARLEQLVSRAVEAVPACARAPELRGMVRAEAGRFLPHEIASLAAA